LKFQNGAKKNWTKQIKIGRIYKLSLVCACNSRIAKLSIFHYTMHYTSRESKEHVTIFCIYYLCITIVHYITLLADFTTQTQVMSILEHPLQYQEVTLHPSVQLSYTLETCNLPLGRYPSFVTLCERVEGEIVSQTMVELFSYHSPSKMKTMSQDWRHLARVEMLLT
jgi:hypothetical protein